MVEGSALDIGQKIQSILRENLMLVVGSGISVTVNKKLGMNEES